MNKKDYTKKEICECGHPKDKHLEYEGMICWKYDYCGCAKYKFQNEDNLE